MGEDFATYTKQEDDGAPVVMFGVWDDDAGFVGDRSATRAEAENKLLPSVLNTWKVLKVDPANTRVRAVHIHDDGVAVTEFPADECETCPAGELATVEAAGRAAYAADRMRAPALDAAVRAAIAGEPVGSPHTKAVMGAFTTGYDAAAVGEHPDEVLF